MMDEDWMWDILREKTVCTQQGAGGACEPHSRKNDFHEIIFNFDPESNGSFMVWFHLFRDDFPKDPVCDYTFYALLGK